MKSIQDINMRIDKLEAVRDRLKRKGYYARAMNMQAEINSLMWVLQQ